MRWCRRRCWRWCRSTGRPRAFRIKARLAPIDWLSVLVALNWNIGLQLRRNLFSTLRRAVAGGVVSMCRDTDWTMACLGRARCPRRICAAPELRWNVRSSTPSADAIMFL